MHNGDRVKYIGSSQPHHRNRFGSCIGSTFMIQEWTYIMVLFDLESNANVINVENLQLTED